MRFLNFQILNRILDDSEESVNIKIFKITSNVNISKHKVLNHFIDSLNAHKNLVWRHPKIGNPRIHELIFQNMHTSYNFNHFCIYTFSRIEEYFRGLVDRTVKF